MDSTVASYVPPPPRTVALRMVLGLLVMTGLVAVLGLLFRDPIQGASTAFIDRFGLAGVFIGVFVADALPVCTHDPILFAAHSGGVPPVLLCVVAMSAAILAFGFDFAVGRLLGKRLEPLSRFADRFHVSELLRHYGTTAIVAAAILPVPFALVVYVIGVSGQVSFGTVVVGSLVRASKIGFTVSAIALGWSIGG
jgi:membrane protein YqaA with SNARE-associated domain